MGNSSSQLVLYFDPEKCTGCGMCMVACSFHHFNAIDISRSKVRVYEDPDRPGFFVVAYCAHCEFPACEAACPVDAIEKNSETGLVTINPLLCIGCKSCNYACPIGMPIFDEERRVSHKCDFCRDIGTPRCVEFCTTGALSVATRREAVLLVRRERE